ncbi:Outer membrane assembly protein [Indibacter alkaliphilus LW1]|uniref:Outer membrane assembly protein n=1 Tax=Indibacter alkaliphilus (strain CCUG 57479 / KCTC 22604 / LW1) TaxID=1189612 RepID=S2DJK1_INDAL|nr:AsmA-like C-terminal region-containing protein [Indibacter alkaliphilus]EOZ92156.1 Outer membrane assembly protein [Indibacter alkaliphilus LW1]
MKKKLLIAGAVFLLILGILIALPFIFKDKIAERIDREIQASVNAQVYYDFNNISLSIFRRFPHISATVREFGIIGNPPFQNDTLIHVNQLQVDFNLRSVLFDEYPTLTGMHLNGGSLYVKVLEDGTANYDITYPTEEAPTESNFKMAVDILEVNDLDLIYNDHKLDFFMALGQIDIEGRGDFTLDVYDLPMKMEAYIADVSYEGTNYLKSKRFKGETVLNVDLEQFKFTLGDGSFTLNDFLFDLQGYIALPEDDIEMDLSFEGKNNSFKSVLSLVPGIYTDSFENLRTSGNMDFRGFMKGIYNESSFPTFDISLKVEDGMFQYPDLPRPVSDINVDMQIANATNNLDNTTINIPTFNMNFGSNPISGRFSLANLVDYTMDGALRGKLNLEELTSIFPVEGITLKGILDVDATAKGRYDSAAQIIPSIDTKLNLSNGFVKSEDYPAPIEKLNFIASIINPSGQMDDFVVDLTQFGFELEDEQVSGNLRIQDFSKLNWDGALMGSVDLGKILAIFPMEDIIMEGKLKADLQTKGSYADVEASRYNRIDMRGEMDLMDFYFNSTDLPQGVRINNSSVEFSPQRINLKSFDSRLGKSPLQASGFLSNYLDYFLKENEVLNGQLNLNSSRFDINEWMTADASDTTELSVIAFPTNIDFNLAVNMDEVLYDNLSLKNVRGNLSIKDGILQFRDAAMSTLGGQVSMNGSYDPRNITEPLFDFNLDISSLSIPRAFEAFNTVKAFAPIAQHLTGNFNTKLNFSGKLGPDMMPILSTLDGKGLLRVAEAAYQNPQLLQAVSQVTRLNESNSLQMRNISIPIEIDNGVMDVRPFDVRLWDYQANIQGSTSFDGGINYLINMEVPAGKFGSMANKLLSTITGTQASESTIIPVSLNLGGTYNNPRVSLAGGNSIENLLSNALRSRVSQERENIQEQATQQFKAAEDSIRREVRSKAETMQDSVKREAERKASETKDRAVDEAKNVLRNVLRPRNTTKPDTTSIR